jgi:hypothetical protein
MWKVMIPFVLILALLLTACVSSPEEIAMQTGVASTSTAQSWTATPSDTPVPTNTPAPTSTPAATSTHTPTPTKTLTPTPTPEPLLAFVGTWSCPECYRQNTIEFYDTGNGLQFLILRDGAIIEWVGPEDCKNIYIPYSECGVTLNEGGRLTVSFVQPVGGGCTQRLEQDFTYQEGKLTRERYESWNYCDGELTQYLDLLVEFGPWGTYSKVE